jgi:glyoxylase-like metal-dependent hydrolase (beta-lactamase superfamily II)
MNEPPRRSGGLLPNGEPKRGSPVSSTLICGREDAVLVDPGFTSAQAELLGDWIEQQHRIVTDIVITHGHGDHWFAADLVAERFDARVVATGATIARMYENVAMRPLLWDKVYPGIPQSPVTAVTVPDNRLTLEGHDVLIVEVGDADTRDNSVVHVPDLALVVAGDVVYNGAHLYLGESAVAGTFTAWRQAIDNVAALDARSIVAGHRNQRCDDDAKRTIAETMHYLDDADELLRTEETAVGFFTKKVERYPNHLGRAVLWAGAAALYGARERPDGDLAELLVAGWL